MFHIHFSHFFSLFISFSLLVGPLPLSAMVENINQHANASYIYLDSELSKIAEIVSQLSDLDKNKNSPLHKLNEHIKNECSVAEYNAVINTLEYAEKFLHNNNCQINTELAKKITTDLDEIIDKIIDGSLTHASTFVINKNLCVRGKSLFDKHIRTKQGIHVSGQLKVSKSAQFKQNVTFKNNVTIRGILSVADIIIDNLTLQNLSVTDLTVTSCIDDLCVNNLSVVDATIENLTLTSPLVLTDLTVTNLLVTNTLSAQDAVIQDLTVANCMASLCVNTLSVVDESVNGTLSVNDEIVQNISATNLSVTDTIIQNGAIVTLSATDAIIQDLTVTNCITNLCVNTLSVVDESVSGTLSVNDEIIKNFLQFNDTFGGEFIGIKAPNVIPTSYTVSLPSTIPTANQVLRANATTPTNLEWITEGGSIIPAASKTIYVTKYGNDTTGNGSFDSPFATLSKAIAVANLLASLVNPIAILISSGIYVENNSVGPLTITAAGISIGGDSASSVIIIPNTPANDFLLITNTVRLADITIQSATPLATGISLTAGNLSVFNNLRILNFLTGVSCTGVAGNSYGFNECLFVNNNTALVNNNAFVECNNITIFGIPILTDPASNTGIVITGASARLVLSGGICGVCTTAVNISNNANLTISGVGFRGNAFDILQTGPSNLVVSGCTFELTNDTSDIDIQISGAGAIAEIISCEFNGKNLLGISEGTGISISDNASVNMSGSTFHNYATAIQVGIPSDSNSTLFYTSAVGIRDCTIDIAQQGTASLSFNAGTATSNKISINDTSNVTLSFFDLDTNSALTIGSLADQNTTLVQAALTSTNNPEINYLSSFYSTQAIGFDNSLLNNPASWFILSNDEAHLTGVTTNRTEISGLRLVSDTTSPIGGTTALRGWDINKNGSAAELSFKYQNSDIVGQIAIPQYTVMQLDGFNNQLQLPTAGTQIVFDGDTNLYRNSANVLKTDDNFIVGTLTPDRVVVTAPVTNQLASSVVTGTELSYLSGVTSSVQTQINSKVAKSGDIMTGTLELPAGTIAAPSLTFTGSTTTGLSTNAGALSFSTSALERMKIDSTGTISIDAFIIPGIVHNDASGNLSSSLIVDADITNATISNAKLATISSANTSGNIVVRDGLGNFAANMISLAGAVVNNTDAATKAYVDSAIALGIVAKTPARVVSLTNVDVTTGGLLTIDSVTLAANDRVLLVNETNPIENGLWLAQVSAWTRPADFANGTQAGQAYVLIASGAINAGSSYLCNTPTAVIGTDPIGFSLFSLPDVTTGANVGAGTGLVFRNKTGITLNFRSLLAGTHISIINNADDITFTTDATNTNTPSTIVARDASGNFSATSITANLIGAASLNVLKTGDIMTGALQLPAGTTIAPSLTFTGSTTTGLSASGNNLSFSTNASERVKIDLSGVISINAFTAAGVVHNDASGNLSSALIVNTDVDPAAAIVDTKLATISTAGKVDNSATTATSLNTANAIVARDASGNFSAGTIIANLSGSASNNVLKAGDTMTGALQLPAGTTALPALVFTGSTTTGLSATTGNLSFSTNGLERMQISSGGTISIDGFITPGIIHNDSSGNLSSSLIVNADVSTSAAIVDTKLATISTVGKVANSATTGTSTDTSSTLVLRDGSGNFATHMITIDGTTTNATDVATKAYVDSTAGTSLSTPNTLVKRDSTGSFAAQVVSLVDTVATGNLIFTGTTSTSTTGNITKGGNRFIHNTGTSCTFVGINAGNLTPSGGNNSGFGTNALLAITTGVNNTGLGVNALTVNTTGINNTAIGVRALRTNVSGASSTAVGTDALGAATIGPNTAVGNAALANTSTGTANTAVGFNAVNSNTNGSLNTGIGNNAMAFITGAIASSNTAIGADTLAICTIGSNNIAIGTGAGGVLTAGSGNIYINANAAVNNEATTTRIGTSQTQCFLAGIRGITTGVADAVAVLIDSTGQLGTVSSTIKVKHDVEDMGNASNSLLDLRPVTFVYNSDATNTIQFGLIAEEVDEIFPAIVIKNTDGQPETIQYHVLPVLLLNEIKKQHTTIEELKKNNSEILSIINNLQSQVQECIERIKTLETKS